MTQLSHHVKVAVTTAYHPLAGTRLILVHIIVNLHRMGLDQEFCSTLKFMVFFSSLPGPNLTYPEKSFGRR